MLDGLQILIADDDQAVRLLCAQELHAAGCGTFLADSDAAAVERLQAATFDILLASWQLLQQGDLLDEMRQNHPETQIVALVSADTDAAAQLVEQRNICGWLERPLTKDALLDKLRTVGELARLRRENIRLRLAAKGGMLDGSIVGRSPAAQTLNDAVLLAATHLQPILIAGEPGTGKDMIAQAIHAQSVRRHGPFVQICCSATPAADLSRRLFGRERDGILPSRKRQAGLLRQGNGGSLLLDHVEALSPLLAQRLLTVLDFGQFTREGSHDLERTDIRLIATTSDPSCRGVDALGEFGARLRRETVQVPTLRSRLEDLPELTRHFLTVHANGKRYDISAEQLRRMASYQWPGNIRELSSAVRRATVFAHDGEIAEEFLLPSAPVEAQQSGPQTDLAPRPLRDVVSQAEMNHIAQVLRLTGGNRTRAAEVLGISRKSLWEKMKSHGML